MVKSDVWKLPKYSLERKTKEKKDLEHGEERRVEVAEVLWRTLAEEVGAHDSVHRSDDEQDEKGVAHRQHG